MTDHANLQYWKSPRNLNRRTARWHADLQEYDYEILYIPGKTNIPPDALSHLPGADKGENDNQGIELLDPKRFSIATIAPEGKIHVPALTEVKRGIMTLMHDHPTAGHPGRDETIRKIKEKYWWPNMNQWIADYVKGCATCQQNKNITHQKKIPIYCIPTKDSTLPFQSVAMDLITGLLERRGHDAILTIVNQGCSRAAVFLPCHTSITGPGVAQLYFDNIVQWFGLPTKIISDRDPRFTSQFGRALATKPGITQNLSTAFHPQTDGLSEHKNQWVEQYLRLVTSAAPEDWDQWLTMASAVHNNRRNQTTGLSPNQILLGYEIPLQTPNNVETNNMTVEQRIGKMNQRRDQAIEALNRIAGLKGTPPAQYNTGDQVWLEGKNLKFPHQVSKLVPKQYGPFKIIKGISPVAYRLQLPPTWMIHDMFHASLLSPYSETPAHGPNFSRPLPDLIAGEEEYEVESIKAHRYSGRNKKLQFLIRWKGYPKSDNTWEPADSVHAPDLVRQYEQKTPSFRINSDPNNSSRSITFLPLWHPPLTHTESLEPYPCRPRHLVPSSFTSSNQSACQVNLLPPGPTSSLALHYTPVPQVRSRASLSSHSHTRPPTHLVLSGGQARNSLPISQSHTQPGLTCRTPLPPSAAHHPSTTSPLLAPHHQIHSHSDLPTSMLPCLFPKQTPYPPEPLLTLYRASILTTPPGSGVWSIPSSKPSARGTESTTKNKTSTLPPWPTYIKSWLSLTGRLSETRRLGTKTTTASPCSPSTRVMAYDNPSSGSKCSTTARWRASLKETGQEVPLTSSTSMLSQRLKENRWNRCPPGSKNSLSDQCPSITPFMKRHVNWRIGGSLPTWRGSATSTRWSKRRPLRYENGRRGWQPQLQAVGLHRDALKGHGQLTNLPTLNTLGPFGSAGSSREEAEFPPQQHVDVLM